MDSAALDTALKGLRRFGDADAVRAMEHLEGAVEHSENQPKRWTEQMCYCLREALESIPPLFGQSKSRTHPGTVARRFHRDISVALTVEQPPDVLGRMVSEFGQELDEAERQRRYRIGKAMMAQAGTGVGGPQVEAFAEAWASTVQGVASILHGDKHSEDEALGLLSGAVELVAALVGPISSRLEEVDRYVEVDKPNESDVRRVLRLMADERLARYFFSKVESPGWLEALDTHRVFEPPMQGNWHQGALVIRVSARSPGLASNIATRIIGDPHRAAPMVVLGVARELGSGATALARRVLSAPSFLDPSAIEHEVEMLLDTWSDRADSETFHELADVALEPQEGRPGRSSGKFGEYEYSRLVRRFVERVHCDHLAALTEKLLYKLRRAIKLSARGLGLSYGRELVDEDERADRDVGNALISGVRDAFRRLRECGASLQGRRDLIGDLDDEILIRIWAGHLAEEAEDD